MNSRISVNGKRVEFSRIKQNSISTIDLNAKIILGNNSDIVASIQSCKGLNIVIFAFETHQQYSSVIGRYLYVTTHSQKRM